MPIPVIAAIVAVAEEFAVGAIVVEESAVAAGFIARFGATIWSAINGIVASAWGRFVAAILSSAVVNVALAGGINAWVVKEVRDHSGMELDARDPLSKQSITHAVSVRVGLELDQDQPFSKASIARAMTKKVGFAVEFTDITSKDAVLRDIQAPIVVKINEQLGTSFTHLYPVNDFRDQFNQQLALQVEKHYAGLTTCISPGTISTLTNRVTQQIGGRAFPRSMKETNKAQKQRTNSKNHYIAMVNAGYRKEWVKRS